ncbi:MAG TPA: response regulator [Polyangiaceae bacterium]|nr:response regulator [Polyangiaceae bacterium]
MSQRSAPSQPPHDPSGVVRVLVVDDSEILRLVAGRILTKLGCTVELACDGEEALAMLATTSFDLVFMDCHMPGADGREVTRAVRERERLSGTGVHVPIVALTGSTQTGERASCLAAGMDDYAAKPFTLEQLQELVHHWTGPK